MRKYQLFFAVAALTFASIVKAADFKASIDRNVVGLSEPLRLSLRLSDTSASSSPDISALEEHFQIVGQQQSSENQYVNGTSSSSTTWAYSLLPLQAGQSVIPAISISTKDGELKTDPIVLEVSANSTTPPPGKSQATRSTTFVGRVSKSSIYKNEPVIVSYELRSKQSLRNIQVGSLNVKDAIVEAQGQPKVQNEIKNGRQVQVLTAIYTVTPLKSGELVIPPLVLRGETIAAPEVDALDDSNDSLFGDDDGDPFAGMQKMMNRFAQHAQMFGGFGRVKPVALSSAAIHINVLPAVASVSPWVPAQDVKMSESWSNDLPKVGEPITRTVTTEVIGLAPSQIPSYEEQIASNENFKIYADRPETSTKIVRDQILSTRKEVLTIIPQRAGSLTVPSLKLAWWDTLARGQKIASVPERTFQVAPSEILANQKNSPPLQPDLESKVTPIVSAPLVIADKIKGTPVFVAFALIIMALIAFLLRELYLAKKVKLLTMSVAEIKPEPPAVPALSKKDLRKCTSVLELQQFLQKYAEANWGVPAHAALARVFAEASVRLAHFDESGAKSITKRIEGALYANMKVDISELEKDIEHIIFDSRLSSAKFKFQENLPELNPS